MPARILVVEDNPANLELVCYLLRFHGHTVLTAVNGEDGVAAAEAHHPDLILCDLQMPVLDGYQVLERLRGRRGGAAIRIVALTAFSMPNDRLRVLDAGFNGYMSKPIDPETFMAQVEEHLPPPLRSAPSQAT